MEQVYTAEQVATHSTPDDAWVIFQGNVYDITTFIPLHPGGSLLNKYLGQDVEKVWIDGEFSKHLNSNNAYSILSHYKIGRLAETFKTSKSRKSKKIEEITESTESTETIESTESTESTESIESTESQTIKKVITESSEEIEVSNNNKDTPESNLLFFIVKLLFITVTLGVVSFVLSSLFIFPR